MMYGANGVSPSMFNFSGGQMTPQMLAALMSLTGGNPGAMNSAAAPMPQSATPNPGNGINPQVLQMLAQRAMPQNAPNMSPAAGLNGGAQSSPLMQILARQGQMQGQANPGQSPINQILAALAKQNAGSAFSPNGIGTALMV